jgi:hypothetical protein
MDTPHDINSLFLSSEKGEALSGKCVAAEMFAILPAVVQTEWHRLETRYAGNAPMFVVFRSSSEIVRHTQCRSLNSFDMLEHCLRRGIRVTSP